MAADEALFRAAASVPVLRIYRWDRPAFSLGYFQKWEEIRKLLPPQVSAVRRWTGGGLVDHRADFTYSLVVPSASRPAPWPAGDSYAAIHDCLARTLRDQGVGCHLAADERTPSETAGQCFAGGHARHDILSPRGKIAGAAQRRNRNGLLHQGSISIPDLAARFPEDFAATLAERTRTFDLPKTFEEEVARLVAARYADAAWLEKF